MSKEVTDKQNLPRAVKKVIRRRAKNRFNNRGVKIKRSKGRPKKDSLRYILNEIDKILTEDKK